MPLNNNTSKKPSDGSKKNPDTHKNRLIAATLLGAEGAKIKTTHFKVIIKCTLEQFNIYSFPISYKIRDLKAYLEFITGIPYNLQRLSYLDDGELIDPKELQYYDVIDGAILMMDIWSIYLGLIKAVVLGDFKDVLKQGVSQTEEWSSAATEYMFKQDKAKYIKERSGIALFVASHRGNINMVRSLLSIDADIDYKSSFGRSPLMIALASDKIQIVDILLDACVDIEIEDMNGETAVQVAKKFNNKLGQHRLAQFKWRKRTEEEIKTKKEAKHTEQQTVFNEKRLPHQIFDSSQKTWFKGNFMQIYMAHLVPPDEYSGTKLSAPKSIGIAVLKQHLTKSNTELSLLKENDGSEAGSERIQKGITFDKWLAQKLRAKRLELLKKKEEQKVEAVESNEMDLTKDVVVEVEPDKSTWMRDYAKKRDNFSKLANRNEDNPSRSSHSQSAIASRMKLETNSIYKGMPYDEWVKIYDEFVKKKLEN